MPTVSIIIPCYNEEKTIGMLLAAIHQQTYPLAEMEVIISDGMSEDGTRAEIEKFRLTHPDLPIQIVNNRRRNIPAALNSAINVSKGEFIVRLDAHSKPEKTYVERSIQALRDGRGDNIGGIWLIEPGGQGRIARAIALAAAHPLGVGDAFYRFATEAGDVDTVPFGAFRRSLVEEIGGYDESLLTNEDYELNTRIRQRGGKVWLDPQIRSVYFARSSLGALSRQYYRYGYWKWRMLKNYPGTLRYRQALPPLFILSLIVLALIAPFWWLAAVGLLAEVVLYIGIMKVASIPLARKNKDIWLIAAIPLAIATMHLSWGCGFWVSFITSIKS
jgi:succinoglycan biosynthesis protein ExoA